MTKDVQSSGSSIHSQESNSLKNGRSSQGSSRHNDTKPSYSLFPSTPTTTTRPARSPSAASTLKRTRTTSRERRPGSRAGSSERRSSSSHDDSGRKSNSSWDGPALNVSAVVSRNPSFSELRPMSVVEETPVSPITVRDSAESIVSALSRGHDPSNSSWQRFATAPPLGRKTDTSPDERDGSKLAGKHVNGQAANIRALGLMIHPNASSPTLPRMENHTEQPKKSTSALKLDLSYDTEDLPPPPPPKSPGYRSRKGSLASQQPPQQILEPTPAAQQLPDPNAFPNSPLSIESTSTTHDGSLSPLSTGPSVRSLKIAKTLDGKRRKPVPIKIFKSLGADRAQSQANHMVEAQASPRPQTAKIGVREDGVLSSENTPKATSSHDDTPKKDLSDSRSPNARSFFNDNDDDDVPPPLPRKDSTYQIPQLPKSSKPASPVAKSSPVQPNQGDSARVPGDNDTATNPGAIPSANLALSPEPNPIASGLSPEVGPITRALSPDPSPITRTLSPDPGATTRALTPEISASRPEKPSELSDIMQGPEKDPAQTLVELARQSETLYGRYASLRSDRVKMAAAISASLRDKRAGPDYVDLILDQHLSLNAINSSMDICLAKLKSIECSREDAIAALISRSKAKVNAAEEVESKEDEDGFEEEQPTKYLPMNENALPGSQQSVEDGFSEPKVLLDLKPMIDSGRGTPEPKYDPTVAPIPPRPEKTSESRVEDEAKRQTVIRTAVELDPNGVENQGVSSLVADKNALRPDQVTRTETKAEHGATGLGLVAKQSPDHRQRNRAPAHQEHHTTNVPLLEPKPPNHLSAAQNHSQPQRAMPILPSATQNVNSASPPVSQTAPHSRTTQHVPVPASRPPASLPPPQPAKTSLASLTRAASRHTADASNTSDASLSSLTSASSAASSAAADRAVLETPRSSHETLPPSGHAMSNPYPHASPAHTPLMGLGIGKSAKARPIYPAGPSSGVGPGGIGSGKARGAVDYDHDNILDYYKHR